MPGGGGESSPNVGLDWGSHLRPLTLQCFPVRGFTVHRKDWGSFHPDKWYDLHKLESHIFQLCNKRPCAPSSGVGGNSVELNFFLHTTVGPLLERATRWVAAAS